MNIEKLYEWRFDGVDAKVHFQRIALLYVHGRDGSILGYWVCPNRATLADKIAEVRAAFDGTGVEVRVVEYAPAERGA
jgi:hypothetical protein